MRAMRYTEGMPTKTHSKQRGKESVFVTMSIRFRKDIHEKIARLAAQESRSIAGQITEMIKQAKEHTA